MRILVVSARYPPVALGGYELECASVVERLRERHEVLVLTSNEQRDHLSAEPRVSRELTLLSTDWRGALAAPLASLRASAVARRALSFEPDLIYVWNGAGIPQVSLRVLADSGRPLAFRVCEHWFGEIFLADQFLRELLPVGPAAPRRGPVRSAWSIGCRALNRLAPGLRINPTASLRTAISWNSQALRRMAQPQPFVQPLLERVEHPVPPYGDLYDAVIRDPAHEPEIVFLGRVTPYKGVAIAIEALALLGTEHGLAARLIVLGPEDAGHGEELRRLAARLGVAAAIDWRGQVTPQQGAAVLAEAHALIVPSVWDEPFGMVTIEGGLARVPLVAADVGGISEGMRSEEHALLFPRGDAPAAAAALLRTLREPAETAARVARAYERAQAFRIGPYLDAQERFVQDAHAILRRG